MRTTRYSKCKQSRSTFHSNKQIPKARSITNPSGSNSKPVLVTQLSFFSPVYLLRDRRVVGGKMESDEENRTEIEHKWLF